MAHLVYASVNKWSVTGLFAGVSCCMSSSREVWAWFGRGSNSGSLNFSITIMPRYCTPEPIMNEIAGYMYPFT